MDSPRLVSTKTALRVSFLRQRPMRCLSPNTSYPIDIYSSVLPTDRVYPSRHQDTLSDHDLLKIDPNTQR